MKKTIAKKWVAALRSGKYKQGREVLHNNESGKDTYCCLGVLCDLYQQDRRSKKKKMLNVGNRWTNRVSYDDFETVLPDAVREWAGMKTDNGVFDNGNFDSNLTFLNDEKRNNFKTIASVIEKNVENL